MIFGENSHVRVLLVVAVFGTLLVHFAAAQQTSTRVQLTDSLVKKLKTSGLAQTGVQVSPFQPDRLARKLASNQQGLMAAPPQSIASSLEKANLPSTSPKRFSLPAVSGANFLSPTTVQPAAWKYFSTHAADAWELRSNKHPNMAPSD
jgi:hypothetical protein